MCYPTTAFVKILLYKYCSAGSVRILRPNMLRKEKSDLIEDILNWASAFDQKNLTIAIQKFIKFGSFPKGLQKAHNNNSNNNIDSYIFNLINMIKHVNTTKKITLILIIAFKKAFESIDQGFMESALGSGSAYSSQIGSDTYSWGDTLQINASSTGCPSGRRYLILHLHHNIWIPPIQLNYTNTIAQQKRRSETFADATSIYISRTEV